jgi:UDP-N-acetylmuramoyl-tripeptide--D-alanyl-D-alanine ligase
MMPMMTLGQAQRWIPGSQLVGDGSVALHRVHTDTRTVAQGDLFVALQGERFDGAAFLAEARAQGAVAALCAHSSLPQLMRAGLPGLLVPDAKVALGTLSAGWRSQFSVPLIAVTGSNGKTTVTQMIAAILKAWMGEAALATQGNLNNEIGVPLTLLRLRDAHRVAVIELGMNHPGEIAHLAGMARPTVALVNNAQREHQEFMATVEAVARENGAVIEALDVSGQAVFPADDTYTPLWRALCAGRSCWTFTDAIGLDGVAVRGHGVWQDGAWMVQVETPAGHMACRLGIAGRHNVRNALAAASCALAAGAPLEAVRTGLERFEAVKGRSRAFPVSVPGRSITVVDDTYNANPDSVRAAIDVLAELPGPRWLVLGDMGEVGDQGPQFHVEVGAYAKERGVEHVLTLGTLARHTAASFQGARHFDDMSLLQKAVQLALPDAGSVLVKGSRFMRMERVVDAIAQYAREQKKSKESGSAHVA